MEALLVGLAALLAFAAVIVAVGSRLGLPLSRVMALRGIVAGSDPAAVRKLERARRRCAACSHIVRCERWLVRKSEPLENFCPNARFLAELTLARQGP